MTEFNLSNTKNLQLPFGIILPEVNSFMADYNGHMSSYMSIEEYYEACLGCSDEWVSTEERETALKNNSVWQLHWYPSTPIGSFKILASSLEAALKALGEINPNG